MGISHNIFLKIDFIWLSPIFKKIHIRTVVSGDIHWISRWVFFGKINNNVHLYILT